MTLALPDAPAAYDRHNEQTTRDRIEQALSGNVSATSLVLQSPDGSFFEITVDDTGALVTTEI